MKHGFIIKTLGALALGVFCSCTTSNTADPFAQDRNITAIDLPEIDTLVNDSILKGTYPDSLSGWVLRWSPPLSKDGAQALYILGDSLTSEAKAALVNGAGGLDFGALGLAAPLVSLSVDDSLWRIPERVLHGRGRKIPTDKIYWFTVWIRYASGAVGPPVSYRLFLGDEFPPEVPPIDTVVGQTFFEMSFDRPRDMKSRFDTLYLGRVDSVRAIWWRGTHPRDSVVRLDSDGKTVLSHPDTTRIARDSILDTAIHRLSIGLSPMAYDNPYMVILQFYDDTGNVSSVGPFPVNTRDARLPSAAGSGSIEVLSKNRVRVNWSAATDSFANRQYLPEAAPNYAIRSYRLLLASPANAAWRPVDSLDLFSEDTSNFHAGAKWPARTAISRFAWNGTQWSWIWPNLPPGDSFRVAVLVRDRSGNPAADTLFIAGRTKSVENVACDPTKATLPILGNDTIGNYCIERFEHVASGKVVREISWADAGAACQAAGGELCSEYQWQRACETVPDEPSIYRFGALEAGLDPDLDTLAWLQSACGVGGGPGDSAAASDTARRDPRCVSGWGVRDMPGQMAEWTRDVWTSLPDTISLSRRDSWSGAYLDTSDYTRASNLGVLHGGSWLDLGDLSVRMALARCRGRTYPATSARDTLSTGKIIPQPDPTGTARSWGFRCCFKPL